MPTLADLEDIAALINLAQGLETVLDRARAAAAALLAPTTSFNALAAAGDVGSERILRGQMRAMGIPPQVTARMPSARTRRPAEAAAAVVSNAIVEQKLRVGDEIDLDGIIALVEQHTTTTRQIWRATAEGAAQILLDSAILTALAPGRYRVAAVPATIDYDAIRQTLASALTLAARRAERVSVTLEHLTGDITPAPAPTPMPVDTGTGDGDGAEVIADWFHARVLDGTYPPGYQLSIPDVQENFAVSHQLARAALNHLPQRAVTLGRKNDRYSVCENPPARTTR